MTFKELQERFGQKGVLKQFIRNPDRTKRGVMLGLKDHKDNIYVGWSLCHPWLDKFDEEFGLQIAYGRALAPETRKMKVPEGIMQEVTDFCWRCDDYFQEGMFATRINNWIME